MNPLPGYRSSKLQPVIRWLTQDDRALLHHGCGDPNLRYLVPDPDVNWWACKSAERAIDEDALFDAYCKDCEQRWVEGGHRFWNPEELSEDELRVYALALNYFDFKKPSYGYRWLYGRPRREVAQDMLDEGSNNFRHGSRGRAIEAYNIAAGLGDEDQVAEARAKISEIEGSCDQ